MAQSEAVRFLAPKFGSIVYFPYNFQSNNELLCIPLLKCFCGCSDIRIEEIRSILNSSALTAFQNHKSRQLFRSFLETKPTANPKSTKALNCFERCEHVRKVNSTLDNDTYKELRGLCVEFEMERKLKQTFRRQDDKWPDVLAEIMKGCCEFLEIKTGDYKRFTDALSKKVEKSKSMGQDGSV
jgi:hypothetical protein